MQLAILSYGYCIYIKLHILQTAAVPMAWLHWQQLYSLLEIQTQMHVFLTRLTSSRCMICSRALNFVHLQQQYPVYMCKLPRNHLIRNNTTTNNNHKKYKHNNQNRNLVRWQLALSTVNSTAHIHNNSNQSSDAITWFKHIMESAFHIQREYTSSPDELHGEGLKMKEREWKKGEKGRQRLRRKANGRDLNFVTYFDRYVHNTVSVQCERSITTKVLTRCTQQRSQQPQQLNSDGVYHSHKMK